MQKRERHWRKRQRFACFRPIQAADLGSLDPSAGELLVTSKFPFRLFQERIASLNIAISDCHAKGAGRSHHADGMHQQRRLPLR